MAVATVIRLLKLLAQLWWLAGVLLLAGVAALAYSGPTALGLPKSIVYPAAGGLGVLAVVAVLIARSVSAKAMTAGIDQQRRRGVREQRARAAVDDAQRSLLAEQVWHVVFDITRQHADVLRAKHELRHLRRTAGYSERGNRRLRGKHS